MNIKEAQHIYFIGIGGIGISALAKMMLHQGKVVSGINDSESSETLDELRELGVDIIQLTNVRGDSSYICEADLYIYSAAWEGRAPEVLEKARATGKLVLSYFEALGEVAKEYKVIAISGTHGKTTTTAMTAQSLIAAGLDPTVIVGSLVNWTNARGDTSCMRTNFRAGSSDLLVVEACEYKRHFLNLDPYILAVTNIELDHPDYYRDLKDVEDAFAELASKSEIVLAEDSINKYILQVPNLKVPGKYNKHNAALAMAICDELGVNMDIVKEALENFTGTWRRFEYLGKTKAGADVYDDYAHHPTAIKATLKGAREKFGSKRIIVVFESHTYSRTGKLMDDFAGSFSDADEIIITPIYAAREKAVEGVTAEVLANNISEYNSNVQYADTLKEAGEIANNIAKDGSVIIFMGAGDIYQIAESMTS